MAMSMENLEDLFSETGIRIGSARTQLLNPVNLQLLYDYYLSLDEDTYPEEAASIVEDIKATATDVYDHPDTAMGDRTRTQFYNYYTDLITASGLLSRAPSTAPMTSPLGPPAPNFAPVSPFETNKKSTQTSPMQTNSTTSLAPIIVPGQTTTLTSQTLPQHAIDSLGNSIPPGQTTTLTPQNLSSIAIPSSEQDLERYVQLSMKYGPQRAKDIIKTYGYSPQSTERTVDRGRHDYTPMTIARYTDFLPERDLFQRGLNRWGYPIGPRLLGKQYIDGIR